MSSDIIGIDPGKKVTGYGIIDRQKNEYSLVTYGEIKMRRGFSLSQCLKSIYGELIEIIRTHQPRAMALEDIFYGKNVQSLIQQGHVRGIVMLAASHYNIPIYEYTPLEIKKAVVGYGRAEKSQVQHMIKALLKLPVSLPEDASDALAVAICHANFRKVVSI